MIEKVKSALKELTGHKYIILSSRGNKAIQTAIATAQKINPGKSVLYPDEGGWLSYPKIPLKLGLKPVQVKTELGVIDVDILLELIKKNSPCCFIYQNPAGYFAEQPASEIYHLANETNVILDASGGLGSDMCDGKFADMIVGSFGKWKVADAGYGGFVSFKEKKNYDLATQLFENDFDVDKAADVYNALNKASATIKSYMSETEKIKKDLAEFNIAHRNKRGINVIVLYQDVNEKNQIIKYCETNKYEWTQCPRYIRVNENAISIEVKRGKK